MHPLGAHGNTRWDRWFVRTKNSKRVHGAQKHGRILEQHRQYIAKCSYSHAETWDHPQYSNESNEPANPGYSVPHTAQMHSTIVFKLIVFKLTGKN
jgi:hypothetical protein